MAEKDALGIAGLRITIQNLYGMRQFIFAILFLTICMGLPFGCAQQAQTADEEADRMAIPRHEIGWYSARHEGP